MEAETVVTFSPKGTASGYLDQPCDAWVIENVASFDDFIAIYDEKSAAHPNHHIFSTFDDFGQAIYTSGHAMHKYDLDPPWDETAVPEANYAVTYAKFMALTGGVPLSAIAGRLGWDEAFDIWPSLVDLNADPSQCLDDLLVMQIVPVSVPEDALAVFPNGYFVDDLTPFENYALAAHLRSQHGYKIIAIGASYVCYLREQVVDKDTAAAVSSDVAVFLSNVDDSDVVAQLADALTGKRHLILCYTDRC